MQDNYSFSFFLVIYKLHMNPTFYCVDFYSVMIVDIGIFMVFVSRQGCAIRQSNEQNLILRAFNKLLKAGYIF